MRDLFDEFMDEVRRRQAGDQPPDQRPGKGAAKDPDLDEDDGATEAVDGPDARDSQDGREATDDAATDDPVTADADDDDAADAPARPRPIAGGRRGGRGGGGGRRPTRVGGPNDGASFSDGLRRAGRRLGLVAIAILGLFLFALAISGIDLATDTVWYQSVGFSNVFWTRLTAQVGLFFAVLAGSLVFLVGNLWLAARLIPPPDPTQSGRLRTWVEKFLESGGPPSDNRTGFGGPFGGPAGRGPGRPRTPGEWSGRGAVEIELPDLTPAAVWIAAGFAMLVSFALATSLAGRWETVLLFQQRVPFGVDAAAPVVDPIFGRDIGFYLFELPFLRLAQSLVNALLLTGLIVALARYIVAGVRGGGVFTTPVRLHMAVLAGLYLVSVAAGYQLDKYELVYSTQGFAVGVSYTDEHAQFLAFDVLTAISALAGAFLVGGAFTRLLWPLGVTIGAWVAASILLVGIYPSIIQRVSVEPNEFAQERPYIQNNISMTRLAFGLDRWEARGYRGDAPLGSEDLDEEELTFRNARLWDYRPLHDTLGQLQIVRSYYEFVDVDTDRYDVNGETRQVMLSARELNQDRTGATSWVNERLTFTHGIGTTMVPVNEVTPEGLPRLWIRDLPPVSIPGVPPVTQPRIYFGERASDWVIVNARQPEFDYPAGPVAPGGSDQGTTTAWTGTSGIRLDSTLTRLMFAIQFGDLNLLISDQVTRDSQLLMYRSLSDRVGRIAPFLRFDKDPYLVVTSDGRLVYILDAYTTSDRFPNAEWFSPAALPQGTGLAGEPFNYIRNSVKVVMDAYDGTMTFYAAEPGDAILRAYMGVFPGMFRPLSDVPANLRPHLRVPEELFNVQTRVFSVYHVTDPETLYRQADLWTVPVEAGSQQSLPTEAYYVVMRMPGEPNAEFLLLQPMLPRGRPNMIAWVAARSDGEHYGQTRVYQFPQDTSVLGPNQIEAQISSDPIISAQISLWNQSGSEVIRGNLLVVPIQDSIIYLQPVYLQASTGQFPTFQRIVVATTNRIVWANTLSEALRLVLAGGPSPTPTPTPTPGTSPGPDTTPAPTVAPTPGSSLGPIPPPPTGDVVALIAYANEHFDAAQAALRAGDFARYGQEISAVEEALRVLGALVGASATP